MNQESVEQILEDLYQKAESSLCVSFLNNAEITQRVEKVCRTKHACTRLIMSCLLGKLLNPKVDPRKPYTEIQTEDCFSGRWYDEQFLTGFISKHLLPCRNTTAYLTPVFRTINVPLEVGIKLEGRPRQVIDATIQLLDDVVNGRVDVKLLLTEFIRTLVIIRDEEQARLDVLLKSIRSNAGELPLSSNDIIHLIEQHLRCKYASRIPVLIVAAAYKTAENKLGERVLTLHSHTAADLQTDAMGDVEICLEGDHHIVTVYEMKMKKITKDDVNLALAKIAQAKNKIHNYIFISTEKINDTVSEYAAASYQKTGGTEVVILDCLGFLRHFLHLFHRLRKEYIDTYQELVLQEPDSSVNQSLKEAFLILRKNAETVE